MQAIESIAFFRVDDRIVIWLDTREGWKHFDEDTRLSREDMADVFRLMDTTTELSDRIILPIVNTSLPLSILKGKIFGIHPLLTASVINLPVWDGPATRAQELEQEAHNEG